MFFSQASLAHRDNQAQQAIVELLVHKVREAILDLRVHQEHQAHQDQVVHLGPLVELVQQVQLD